MATDTISSSSQTKAVFDVSDNGWIKIDRAISEHWIFSDAEKFRAWVDLLMLANYEDKKVPYKGEVITCKRGDVCRSISYLADRWGWNRRTARKFLSALESDGMVTVKCTTNRTTVTIENYGKYQDGGTTECTTKYQRGAQRGNSGVHTYKKDKEIKESKEDITLSPNVHDGVVSFDF